jgi:cytochrome c2
MRRASALLPVMFAGAAASLAACGRPAVSHNLAVAGGDPQRGERVIAQAGCGACHQIPGVRGAAGLVGPPLDALAERTVIAGVLPNTPDNLVRWIQTPQAVVPGNAMPDMGLTPQQARDVAAYLGTLT